MKNITGLIKLIKELPTEYLVEGEWDDGNLYLKFEADAVVNLAIYPESFVVEEQEFTYDQTKIGVRFLHALLADCKITTDMIEDIHPVEIVLNWSPKWEITINICLEEIIVGRNDEDVKTFGADDFVGATRYAVRLIKDYEEMEDNEKCKR